MSGCVRSPAQGRASTPSGRELPHPLGDADGVQVARHDLGAGRPERERHRVADLAGAADAGHQHHLAAEIERRGGHAHLKASRTISAPGAPAWLYTIVPSCSISTTDRAIVSPSGRSAPYARAMASPGSDSSGKWQPEPLGVAGVARGGRRIHPERANAMAVVQGQVVAHGGQLAVSAGRIVARIERQQHEGVGQQLARGCRRGHRTPRRRNPARGCRRRAARSRGARAPAARPAAPPSAPAIPAARPGTRARRGSRPARDRRASRCRRCGAGRAGARCR